MEITIDDIKKFRATLSNETVGLQLTRWQSSFSATAQLYSGISREYTKRAWCHADQARSRGGQLKANEEYDKFRKRTQYQPSPVEIHFLEALETEQKRLRSKK